MPALHGIDVSHNNLFNNGPIDWNAVATTTPSLEFVIARMSHGGRNDGNLRIDRQATNNRDGMRAAFPDTARGYYHFLGNSAPSLQAQHFRDVVGDLQPGEFIMLDVEPDEPADVGILPVEHIVATLEAIEAAFSLTPMLYIGLPYPGKDDPRMFRFPLVFPAFTSEERAMGFAAQMGRPPVIWQWGGGANGPTIAGISGRVDANRIEDMDRFRAALVGGTGPEIPVIPHELTGAPLEFMPTLAAGSEGNAVVVLQGLLIERGLFLDRPANRDGRFESETDERVRQLQAERSLPVNGVVDTATWAALATPVLVPA
jgi:GH25 family lysozyme M1 (1,4-beta-N-acetylmuramidase)